MPEILIQIIRNQSLIWYKYEVDRVTDREMGRWNFKILFLG